MQNQSHSAPAAQPIGCRRQVHPILTTVISVGALLSCASAGEPASKKSSFRGREIAAADESGQKKPSVTDAGPAPKENTTAAEPAPLPTTQQVAPDPLLPPELSNLPDPVIDAGPARRREERAGLREEGLAENMPADEETPGDETETFVVPGFYGRGSKVFTLEDGKLAALPMNTTFTLGIGYDDNIESSTSGAGAEKVGSAFTTARLATSYHTAGQMQVFVFDGAAGTDIYWGGEDPDYDLSLGIAYQRRFVSPAKVSANVGFSYKTQPDYNQVNLVRGATDGEDEGDSGVLSASAKVDLSYAWTAQFSTLTSLSAETILYGGDRSSSDSLDITIGNELRYRVDRYTWIGEARYQFNARPNDQQQEGDTLFLLGGVEWHLGPWLQISSRVGATARTYQEGDTTTSPHGELAITFAPNVQNSFALNARYGLERTAIGTGDSKTFRVGGSYTRMISSRMSGTISASYIRTEDDAEAGGNEDAFQSTGGGERIFDMTASLNYRLTNRLGMSASITCTRGDAGEGQADPDRNRLMFTANYQF